ncbi:LacI family DNA-binding transcriptional regulator [Cupriavidus sp. WS]|uniref:LacI family DNA-binding transcriptional regulator n=1 Tax=Cupriavidus sp. WS TaxID=1312922 RepID=UPI0018C9C952|nr:substrate-binding domain-containing protein [Cupriavidus sp. WS]
MKSVTIRDVAREAGVSVGTASRVINEASNVEPENRVRVRAAIEKLGFVPNRAAQSMRNGSNREIGIIVRDITIPVLAGFVKAAQSVFDQAGYVLLISSAENEKSRELELLSLLRRRRVDGLIMTTASQVDAQLASAREHLGFPVVLFDRDIANAADCVLIDHAEGMRQAVSHLLSLGHRRILLVTGDLETYPAQSRIQGYRQAHQAAGIPVDEALIHAGSFEASSAFVETASMLGMTNRPSAVIAGGIGMLPGVMKAVRAHSLRIPEDISVIGNGDSDLAVLASPAITVIKWDYSELGRTSARMILDRIASRAVPAQRRILFPTELVIRGSCAAPLADA